MPHDRYMMHELNGKPLLLHCPRGGKLQVGIVIVKCVVRDQREPS